ncbi:glycoside hydrolase family 78 protein [Chryseolinea sp. T2]|uniref:glycoside hydrolase family 78 protein n=1 Tax=Chryseolinea sp. T2 TaxID=3129255 RepID=UPI003076F3FF
MRTLILVLIAFCSVTTFAQKKLQVTDLTCEHKSNPIGIDTKVPRFSWKLVSALRGVKQQSYELRVGEDPVAIVKGEKIIWQTNLVNSDQSVLVPYNGPATESRKRYHWQVRVVDNKGNSSGWSPVQYWEMGLVTSGDWSAKWINADIPGDSAGQPAPMVRRAFELAKSVKQARLYITAHGIYEAYINGARVGEQFLTPGWTTYGKRLQYQVYDVSKMLKKGSNATGVVLGDGWYRGWLAWENNKNIYGKSLGLLYQLEVEYTDGTKEIVTSDNEWKNNTGPYTRNGIYYGEAYDARLESKGWSEPGFDEQGWSAVKLSDESKDNLIAAYGPPVEKHEIFKVQKIIHNKKGETIVDFGQNLVGWIRLTVNGKAGDKVTIHHAEVLDKEGNFYIDNLRAAKQEIVYTLKGGGQEVYEPRLSFFGFRYIRVTGFPGELKAENLEAIALYSDMAPTGTFTSSSPLLNQLQHNIQWGQKGNFVDVPTDCPQRDERLGWTGDAQAFCRTATYNMNVMAFFNKWLQDLSAEQDEEGRVPFVIPNVLGKGAAASAGWADAATIIPWNLYRAYGDQRILEQQYESMKKWVGYMDKSSMQGLWNTGFHFGDWLFYRPFDDNDGRAAVTDKYLIAQCFWAHSTQLMINAATVLGKKEDIALYTDMLKKIKEAFMREYMTPSGRLVAGTQTAYVLALNFDMLPENLRAQAADRLAKNVRDYGNHLTTGFLGTPYLCHVLTRFGHTDIAYDLLLQETYPSWLYPVKMGATTIWERWDGMKPDSTFQTPGMNSFNHYAYGAIGDWMYRTVAGLQEMQPGYKELSMAPKPGAKLTKAVAEYITPYGKAKSSWEIADGKMKMEVTVPANTTATLVLPSASGKKIIEKGIDIGKVNAIGQSGSEGNDVILKVGSGSYVLEYPFKR